MKNRYRNAHITSSGLIPAASDFSGPGEFIPNIADGKIYTLDYNNNIVQLGGGGANISSSYAATASFALNGGGGGASGSSVSASYSVTASFATKAKRSEVEFHVADYFDSSVSTDWGIAINAAIADCLGAADPVVSVREAKGPIILPPGKLQVRTQIAIKSAIGVFMRGSSRYSTALCPDALDSGLDLVGVVYSSFRDFSIRGAGTINYGVHSYHDAAQAIKFPSTNTFINVDVMELTYNTAFWIGSANNSDQTDRHNFYDCKVQGQWTWGSGFTTWANGFLFGHEGGGAGNNLVHNIFGLEAANLAYAVNVGGSCVNVYGGSTEQTHIVINESGGPIDASAFYGIRAEGSRYLYVSIPGASWDRKTTISDCTFHAGKMEGPVFLQLGSGGTYNINNVSVEGDDPGNFTASISNASIGAATTIIVNGLSLCNGDVSSVESWMTYAANTSVFAKGVSQTNSMGGVVKMVSSQNRLADAATITGSRGSGSTALSSLLNSFKLRGEIKDKSWTSTPLNDDFARAANTSSMGGGWLIANGVGGITTGSQGYFPTASSGRPIALLGTMTNGIVETTMQSSDWNVEPGYIVFRYLDNSNYLLLGSMGPGTVALRAMVSGSTTVYQNKTVTGFSNSTPQTYKIIVTDNILDVFVGSGIPVARWTMTPAQVAMIGTGSGFAFENAGRPSTSLISSYSIVPQ